MGETLKQKQTKKKRVTEKGFKLLLTFLTDSSEETVRLAKDQIRQTLKMHPRYKGIVEGLKDPVVKKQVQIFLEEYRFQELEPIFTDLFQQGDNLDLEKGLFLLSSIEYPDLKMKSITDQLDDISGAVDKMMSQMEPVPTRPIHAMRHYLFEKLEFRGNELNYYEPDNSFINRVLERRLGIPISLSCVYLFVARRLHLPVHGVGLPGHFIVGHRTPRGVTYIDAFNRGKVLRVKDCEVLVRRLGMPFKQEYMDPLKNLQILSRMILNLINVYNDIGNTTRAHWLAQLFQLIEP